MTFVLCSLMNAFLLNGNVNLVVNNLFLTAYQLKSHYL